MQDYFPIFFAAMWLGVTTLLALFSGWFFLMIRFPNQPDESPLLVLKGQSGSMGVGVSMNGILRLSACRSGLRLGLFRLFGPFCRDIYVPWNEISVSRKTSFGREYAELRFGGRFWRLRVAGHVADRLWRAVPDSWPEEGTPPEPETRQKVFADIFRQWAITTALVSAFLIIVPRLLSPEPARPPVLVMILFPAAVCAIGGAVEYRRRRP